MISLSRIVLVHQHTMYQIVLLQRYPKIWGTVLKSHFLLSVSNSQRKFVDDFLISVPD